MNNRKATKRALLTSVMALVMCVVMLVGTTLAWFTDTASTSVNTIKAGNLNVTLEKQEANGSWVSAENETLTWKTHDNRAQDQIFWEPGCTYELQPVRVKNDGNLAIKYKIAITGIKGSDKLNEVIDWTISDTALDTYHSLGVGQTSDALTIKGHMKETAGNTYMNEEITGIAITVYATQDTVEYDSFTNDYDKDADIVAVTPGTISTVDFTKSNAVYQFAAGSYSGTTLTVKENTNTVFEAADGATFDNVTIKYAANRYGVTDKSDSSMIIKGFNVTGVLDVNCADGKLIVENNTAQKIKVIMNRMDGKENADIQFKDNKLNGGNYGIELVPNHSGYTLTISGNEFTNITSNAISVMGYQSDLAATDATKTAAASITVSGNTFNSYGAGKAAFKIWGDINLAPNGTDALTEAAQALAGSVKVNNTFGAGLDSTCVVADFFGKKVTLN